MLRFLQRVLSFTFFIVLVFQTTQVNAQNDSIKNNNESYISFDLTTLLDPRSPRLRVGYIKDISSHWKVGLEAGYGSKALSFLVNGGSNRRIQDDYKLWEVRPEIIWVENPDEEDKRYLSLEVYYMNHKDVFSNGEFRQDGLIRTYSSIDYQREKYGFNIKYGFIFDINDRLKLTMYSGLGLRIRNNSFTNLVASEDGFTEGGFIFLSPDYREKGGTEIGYNFPLGFKLLYKL